MSSAPRTLQAALAATFLAWAAVAAAQPTDVGSVVGAEPRAEIGRADVFSDAAPGAGVRMGDVLRTGRPGKMRVSFADESVLSLGQETTVLVDEAVYDPGSAFGSVFELLKGKVRSVVSEYYKDPQASYEVKTPNAVSGVRGTDFVVLYDADTDITEVLCLGGVVEVRSRRRPEELPQRCRGGQLVRVDKDRRPADPVPLGADRIGEVLGDLDFVGRGEPESVIDLDPLLGGDAVPPEDRAGDGDDGGDGPRRNAPDPEVPGDDRTTPGGIIDQPAGNTDRGSVIIEF